MFELSISFKIDGEKKWERERGKKGTKLRKKKREESRHIVKVFEAILTAKGRQSCIFCLLLK